MYSKIIKNIFFPIYQMRIPREERYIPYLKLLNKTQWWSRDELEKFQLKKLKKILKHANENVPFYHEIFRKYNFNPENVSNVNDLKILPILTKDIIKNNFDNLYARNYPKEKLILSSTSGSTAAPMKFYIDAKWRACNLAAAYREWSWAGYNLGDKILSLWGVESDFSGTRKIDKIREFLLRKKSLGAINLTDENMAVYTEVMNNFKPKIIHSYASVIYLYSEYLKRNGIQTFKPDAILTTADMIYPNQRKTIEEVLNCEVFDFYSGRETSFQAAECSKHTGYHMSIENAVVEFISDDEPVSPGETGKLIITDLSNYAMPFIRYEIGDLGIPTDENCPCGRNLPLIKSIKGRIFDFIITPEGKRISGEYFHLIIIEYNIQGIKEFQIVQESMNKIIAYIVPNQNEKTEDINRFIDIIRKEFGDKVEIELKIVTSIKRTSSGKLRHVISNVSALN